MNDLLIEDFIQLISAITGLHIREEDKQHLSKKLHTRIKALKLSAPEEYYQLLKPSSVQSNSLKQTSPPTNRREREWQELTLLLTTGETYFFRDRGQISLLKNRILPELINSKKYEAKRSLRIWSAGCSTGEEVYSLAILIQELIPEWNKWDILILGTDINSQSIEKAKRGIYDSWSFRMVEPKLKQRYFNQHRTAWKVDEQIRSVVKFHPGNLLTDSFPSSTSEIYNMDVIVCRNVFIYFDFQTISVILKKLSNTLNSGGYLIAGHSELLGQNLDQLQAKVFPESVVYQRSKERLLESSVLSLSNSLHKPQDYTNIKSIVVPRTIFHSQHLPVKAILSTNIKAHAPTKNATSDLQTSHSASAITLSLIKNDIIDSPQTILNQAKVFFDDGAYKSVIKELQTIEQDSKHFDVYYLMAQAFANLGDWGQAIECCQQALKIDSSVSPYYLLAHIAEEQGDRKKAKDLFKKIIYLAPSSIAAYLEIGALYASEGDATRARKMRTTALEFLKKLPADSAVEYQGKVVVNELIIHINNILKMDNIAEL